jgi:hypothetical protein
MEPQDKPNSCPLTCPDHLADEEAGTAIWMNQSHYYDLAVARLQGMGYDAGYLSIAASRSAPSAVSARRSTE